MSKLARKPINISDVEATLTGRNLTIKGKHGQLNLEIISDVDLDLTSEHINVSSTKSAVLGLYCALIKNMVNGVQNLCKEDLVLKGVGYRVSLSNNVLNFNLGYSHPVAFTLPDGVSAELPTQTEIKLSGIDKQLVGQVAAEIIKLRPAKKDPYKEKGIKRVRDRILKKVGKKVK
jgi:large subunit ribosomal protein L6